MSYGKVKESFWTDDKVQSWPNEAKLLALYFLSGPHRNMLGCARVPDGYIIADLGWTKGELAGAVHCLVSNGFMVREATGWTLILNQLRHDPPLNRNQGKGLLALAAEVPIGMVFQELLPRLADALKPIGMGIEALSKPIPQPIPTPEPEPEQEPLPEQEQESVEAHEAVRATTPRDELSKVLDAVRAQAVLEHRIKIRKPLTAHAARLLADKFNQCRDGPNAAADAMIANGWQGFELDWYENRKSNGHARKPSDLDNRQASADAVDAVVAMAKARGGKLDA